MKAETKTKTETKTEIEIGKRVRRFRQANSYTQEKLAEMVEVSTTTISRLENGDQMVGVLKLMQIAEALGVTADTLLYKDETEKPASDEWDERIICLLEKYSVGQKKYIWRMMTELLELHSGD